MTEEEMLHNWDETLLLLDAYESLLSSSQKETLSLYFRFNLSLSEIAEEKGISRAAASDALTKGVKKLHHYESCLGLGKKAKAAKRSIEILTSADSLEQAKSALFPLKEAFDDGI